MFQAEGEAENNHKFKASLGLLHSEFQACLGYIKTCLKIIIIIIRAEGMAAWIRAATAIT